MAGVAVNIGFYGLWRTLALLGAAARLADRRAAGLAGLTALLGIAHATVQTCCRGSSPTPASKTPA